MIIVFVRMIVKSRNQGACSPQTPLHKFVKIVYFFLTGLQNVQIQHSSSLSLRLVTIHTGSDVIFAALNKRNIICITLNDVTSDIFTMQNNHKDEVLSERNILHFSL